jgi:hypothetical protein
MTTSPDRLSDDLAARPSVEPGREAVKVKPLEWFQSSPATWRSQTPINGYIVEKGNKHWRVLPLTPAFIFDTEAEAKTAAQVDYERRILSALEPSSSEPSRDAATAMADAVTVFKHSGGDVEACRNAIRAYAASAAFAAQSEIEGLREALTEIASFTQTDNLLWWQERARRALSAKGE